jgi:PhzF family phenazine biosynthesis protein
MKLYQVDAFTAVPFKGNPAGVHVSSVPLSEELMQHIAMEMNLAETAFVYKESNDYVIRFFTPTTEVPICGHATLAAAHIMYTQGIVSPQDRIDFKSRSGLLSVTARQAGYTLDFPTYPALPTAASELLAFKETSLIPAKELYKSANGWFVAVLGDEAAVQNYSPSFSKLEALSLPIVLLTAPATTTGLDYVMRLFAPAVGIPEDPVTGSAECVLGPLWKQKLGKDVFVVKQLSHRTGIKHVELSGERVLISGEAITMFEIETLF